MKPSKYAIIAIISALSNYGVIDASIIKKPPTKTHEYAFNELPCTQQQKDQIYELITTLAENSKIALLFQQDHLKKIGANIDDVHPLKFLSIVFSQVELKYGMAAIWNDYFKRTGFMDGLGESLSREYGKGTIQQLIKDFAQELKISVDDLKPYLLTQDWNGLVIYLINHDIY
jgi:hypothetical protein